jgi:hypothetical protein
MPGKALAPPAIGVTRDGLSAQIGVPDRIEDESPRHPPYRNPNQLVVYRSSSFYRGISISSVRGTDTIESFCGALLARESMR